MPCTFLILTGCKTTDVKPAESFTDQLLAKQIDEIHYGVQGIVNDPQQITVQKVYNSPAYNEKTFPHVLNRTVDIKWYGKAETLLTSLEKEFGSEFVFRKLGKPIAHPIDVYVNAEKEKLFNVLKNIGYQLGDDVLLEVIIDPFNKANVAVELTYDAKQ